MVDHFGPHVVLHSRPGGTLLVVESEVMDIRRPLQSVEEMVSLPNRCYLTQCDVNIPQAPMMLPGQFCMEVSRSQHARENPLALVTA